MDASRTTLEDWLDELCARFLNNLPKEELQEFSRIGMHLEEAQWFYEDFIRPLNPTTLPNLRIRDFSLRILQHCPVTSIASLDILEKAYDNWVAYKKRIPVRGLIMLNEAMDSAVLVKGWKSSANWSFPRGKINQEEDDLHCAIREVYEETGFNVEEAGLIPENRKVKYFEQTIRDQHLRLYVIPNVPMDTYFEPRTRKEISKIQWYKLVDLPGRIKKKQGHDNNAAGPNASKFYMVAPFMEPLNRWIKQEVKKKDKIRSSRRTGPALQAELDEIMTEEEGMATETRTDLPPPSDAKDHVHEAATRELQRLLKIQPPTQTFHPVVLDQTQDRGQALLAMLQQQKDAPADNQMGSAQTGMAVPQQNVVNARQPPATLDNARQALLDAFKKDITPTQQPAQQSLSSQQRVAGSQRPNQQYTAQNLASLASTYPPAQNGVQSMPIPANGSPQLGAAQAALRPSNVPESQRNALLGIFKQPTTSSPIRQVSQPNLKENNSPKPQQQHPAFFGTASSVAQTNNGSIQANLGLPYGVPYSAQYAAVRPREGDQRSPQPQSAPIAQAMENINRVPHNPSMSSLPYSGTSQLGQPTAQGGMPSFPNISQQHQAADPQQLQKLMSLFSKPSATPTTPHVPSLGAWPPSASVNNGKEPAIFNMGRLAAQLPTPSSIPTSHGTSPGRDEASGPASASRRGSQQVPISPENEKFLLNYLKTVSSSAK
ncbi:mRNA-decapping enzyme subunit 2 [Diaporthe australafricana]|uniref:mRNA-decapping enzyme subunit 2 n=1 Tax=Diaporthe australafricana TaxID=127596 RepID=A0ABR3XET6_9PEZI